ncbi:hypothetical protein TTHERM_00189300 (macronuclear) [Tetrahymena thermophila SB210]|uniref:50S ribosomal protein L35 n=1 Tax=Tetrahymena thermophila (strain SB210) TaxID=312017 RepID=I7M803_TETTS|nr:hypothetical protein TTHERM_00189300 [Tetrahymena thermophila SB210]EAR96361.1 hypothetical protein TTHERM_00189300 [Tetrahymena thermophila SB210]6Z1P_AF Chain AF, bL35m [Tetrahymena thermophila SB210]|eukprot:XP_001016606.1 hypothetical protein TTHERM_00189300 [Tetrahymena thermophila SB210]
MFLLKKVGQALCKNTINVVKQQPLQQQSKQMIQSSFDFNSLIFMPYQTFAFAQFPKMFKTQYKKGRLSSRFRTKSSTWKRGPKTVLKAHKQSNHSALLKRIRIVGPSWDRKLKFKSANHRHQLRKKSRACLKRKRRARYAHPTDFKRLRRLIPSLKKASFKNNH